MEHGQNFKSKNRIGELYFAIWLRICNRCKNARVNSRSGFSTLSNPSLITELQTGVGLLGCRWMWRFEKLESSLTSQWLSLSPPSISPTPSLHSPCSAKPAKPHSFKLMRIQKLLNGFYIRSQFLYHLQHLMTELGCSEIWKDSFLKHLMPFIGAH